jgi:hypothetical protein
MKRIETVFISVGFSILLTLSILLALGSRISNNLFPSAQSVPYGLRADGDPAPPFPPSKPSSLIRTRKSELIADGDPAPPFPWPLLGSNSEERQLRHQEAGEFQLASV